MIIHGKRGDTERKIRVTGVDSVHASQTLYRAYGKTKIRITSGVLVKDD